jgi:MFS family permease
MRRPYIALSSDAPLLDDAVVRALPHRSVRLAPSESSIDDNLPISTATHGFAKAALRSVKSVFIPFSERNRMTRSDTDQPLSPISQQQLETGLSSLITEGVYAQMFGTLTSGVLLIGFALKLGASNLAVGLLASVPFIAQLCQLPAIALVERLRARRAIAVTASVACRVFVVPVALLPFVFDPGPLPLSLLVIGMALSAACGSVASCSWNSWMRDLLPPARLGSFFGHRLFLATSFATAAGLIGGWFVDQWHADRPGAEAYTVVFVLAAMLGLIGTTFLARVPEPPMATPTHRMPLRAMIREPFSDRNFRRLLAFLGTWHFAVNLVSPFFVVYLVSQLHYDIATVTTLTVAGQLANALMLRRWGRLGDRYGNKAVLSVCAPVFLLCILAWPFTAMPEAHRLTTVLLLALHVVMGIAQAGINLSVANVALKLAPHGRATAYLASTSLMTSLAAGIAPIVGGLFADDLATRELSFAFHWASGAGVSDFVVLKLKHWDFFFVLSFAVGLLALNRLRRVREAGEGREKMVVLRLMFEARRSVLALGSLGLVRTVVVRSSTMATMARLWLARLRTDLWYLR